MANYLIRDNVNEYYFERRKVEIENKTIVYNKVSFTVLL